MTYGQLLDAIEIAEGYRRRHGEACAKLSRAKTVEEQDDAQTLINDIERLLNQEIE